ncbi:UNVERIFIED_CONTAM: hypothetical protein HDU68_007899 [Siphonaria sp. JEL0065]|nr:hypothetical protein HDU68_007897 [Siphonaria sp. JEL0065]KAJ3024675.1 hypothetical protein HDU68_007899 [Siphonaria sp. JEL0065]
MSKQANDNILPDDAVALPGMPDEPFDGHSSVRGTLKVYLFAIPAVYIAFVLFSMFTLKNFVDYYAYANVLLIVLFNVLMSIAIKPNRLVPVWMSAFAYFYIVRCLVDVGINLYALILILSHSGSLSTAGDLGVAIYVGILVIECLVTYFVTKHAFTMRACAQQVRQVLNGENVQTV